MHKCVTPVSCPKFLKIGMSLCLYSIISASVLLKYIFNNNLFKSMNKIITQYKNVIAFFFGGLVFSLIFYLLFLNIVFKNNSQISEYLVFLCEFLMFLL